MSRGLNRDDEENTSVSRRRFVQAAGASGITVGLAGCTGGGDESDDSTAEPISTEAPDEEVTLQIGADSLFNDNVDAIEQSLHESGGMPDNISLEVTAGSFESGDRQAKYQQLLNAEQEQPTLLMMDNGWTIPFIARNELTNLSEALPESITSTVKEDYFDSMVATAQDQNGDLYGVPLFAAFPTVQYRKDLFREAGYSDSDFETWATEPMEWSTFSEAVAQVRDETGTKGGFGWQGKNYVGLACCDFVEFMGSWGGSYFGEFSNLFGPVDDRPVTVDEEQVINAVRMMRTFINGQNDPEALSDFTQCSPSNTVSYTEEPSRKAFASGDLVALRNWPYVFNLHGGEPGSGDTTGFGEDLGAMPIPYHTSTSDSSYGPEIGGSTSALGGWHLALNPHAPETQKRAAVQMLDALQTDQVRLDIFKAVGWIPPIPELVDSDQARELDPLGRYVDTLKVAGENSVPRPVTAVWPSQSSKISQQVNAAIRQEKTPEEAMTELQETLVSLEGQG